jgi:hypothetical protein
MARFRAFLLSLGTTGPRVGFLGDSPRRFAGDLSFWRSSSSERGFPV